MEWYFAGLIMLGGLLALMAIGTPVFMAFLIINAAGVGIFFGFREAALEQLVSNAAASVTSFILVPVPLFVLMGELFFRTGLAVRVFDAFDVLIGRVPARLSYIAVGSGTAFAALTGTSVGSAAMMGSMLVPEMDRRGYKSHMSIGPIMGAGGLAILIPPSALAVLLGSIARIDIGSLLLAGVVADADGFFARTVFPWLVIANPGDAFRIYNLAAMGSADVSGIDSLARTLPFDPALALGVLGLWLAALLAAGRHFLRRLTP